MKREMKRKGFTLVELLIVIVVIGILSAMMMLSSTEAVSSAKASNIVSNLRNLKTAALAFYTSSMDYFADSTKTPDDCQDLIRRYLSGNNASDNPELKNYNVYDKGGTWWVVYKIQGTASEIASIQQKLMGRAASVGLVGSEEKGPSNASAATTYKGEEYVALLVR